MDGPSRDAQSNGERCGAVAWIARIGGLGAAATIVVNLLSFFLLGRPWQMLVVIAGELIAIACLVRAVRLCRQGQRDAAGIWTIFSAMLAFGIVELVHGGGGLDLYLAIGGTLLVLIVSTVVLPGRWPIWLIAAVLFILYSGLIGWWEPLPRYDMGLSLPLRIVALAIIGFLAMGAIWQLFRAYRRITTIRTRLLVSFVLVVLIPMVVLIAAAVLGGVRSGQQRAIAQLRSVAALKEDEVGLWLETMQTDLNGVLADEDQARHIRFLLREAPEHELYEQIRLDLRGRFLQPVRQMGRFESLFLLNQEGHVILSTDVEQEERSYRGWTFFSIGMEGANTHLTWELGQWWVDVVRPVLDEQGEAIGVLVGRARLSPLEELMLVRTGLGNTGETYLVSAERAVLTDLRMDERRVYMEDEGVYADIVAAREDGADLYENYKGQPVVGVYHWLEDLNVALVAEQRQAEAFQATWALLVIVGGVALVGVAAAVVVSLILTRGIANPLVELAETAERVAAGDLTQAVRVEREDEIGGLARTFNEMTTQLRDLVTGLERRVQERTKELERRSDQLETAAYVAREAVAIRDVDRLLSEIVHLISERFGFYHVGVFLIDEAREYAVLRAANSAGGQRMLERGHRLRVGEVGIVGYVTSAGEPRIALDVGADATFFDNPDLPLTRSEMALPLQARGEIIGALDVQSTEEAAFTEEDISVLSTLADQVAIAIENSRLVAQTREALAEVETLHYQYLEREWQRVSAERGVMSYEYARVGAPSTEEEPLPEMDLALEKGETVILSGPGDGNGDGGRPGVKSALAVPIRLGDHTIGVIDLQETEEARSWTEDEIDLVETISDQMAQALERTRLFEDTQMALATTEEQAQRLALLNEMSEQLGRAIDVDEVLQVVVPQTALIFDADRVSVAMLTAEGDSLEVIAIHGEAVGRPVGARVPLEDTTLSPLIKEGRLILKTEVEEGEHQGVASLVAAPIYLEGNPSGALIVGSEQPGTYTSRDGNMLLQVTSLLSSAIENRRLFEQARLRAEELAVLNELAETLTATFDVEEVVQTAYQGASRLLDTTNFYIALYDPEKEIVTVPLDVTELAEDGHQTVFPADRGITGHIIRTHRGLLIPENVPERLAKLGVEMVGETPESWVGVPLLVGDEVLGVMAAQSYTTPRAYDEHDLEVLTAVASQTAIALQSANLFAEARLRAEELAVLNELAQDLAASLNVEEVLEITYQGASRLMDTTNFYIGLYDPERDEVSFVLDVAEGGQDEEIFTLPADQGFAGYIIRNRTSILLPDNVQERQKEMGIERVGTPAKSWLGVPLLIGDRVLGVMAVQSYTDSHSYDEHDRDVMTAIASQTAIALQNAYLFEETQTTLAETETLYDASRRISAATNLEEIVAAVSEEVRVPVINRSVLWAAERDTAGEVVAFTSVASWYSGEGTKPLSLGTRFPLDQFPAISLVVGTEMFFSDDIQTDDRADPQTRAVFQQQNAHALAILPLWVGARQTGLLMLTGEEPYHFTEREIRPYRSLVRQMTVAVENLRLLEETSYRATQLETAAEVSQAASSILNLDELLPQAVELIRRRFDLYYVGIFLVDEPGEWAVLRAGTGEPGQRMIEAGHRLRVGGSSMIGWSVAHSEGRIAYDVGDEAIRFDNPLLPKTRSEMALPLVSRGRSIGAMSIQSTQPAAFSEEDITILQTMADQLANAIQNARLFSETERALAETRDLYEVSRDIGAALTPEEVRRSLIDYASRTGVDFARVLLLERDEEGNPTHVVMADGWTVDDRPIQPPGTRLLLSNYPLLDLLSPAEWIVVEDVQVDERVNEAMRMLMEVSGLRSFAAVPIAVGERQIGALLVGADLPASYSDKLLSGLQTVVSQAAISLENLRLLEETRRRAQEMEAINEMGRTITSVLDLDVLLRQIVDITKARFGHYFVSIALVEGNRISTRAGSFIGDTGKRLERGLVSTRLDGPGLIAEVVRKGQPILVEDVLEDPRYLMVPELADTRSELDVPITVKGRVIGVLDVQSDRPQAYDQTDVALLQSLASQAGVAIDNARLFEETQAEAQRRALINEVMQAAARSLDPDELLHEAGEAVSRRLETPSGLFVWEPEMEAFRAVAIHDDRAADVDVPPDLAITPDIAPTLYEAAGRRRTRVLREMDSMGAPLDGIVRQLGVQAAIYVPLIARDQVLGVFCLYQPEGEPPLQPEEVDFTEIVSANLSVALESARLYQEAVETAERLKEVDRLKTQFLANMSHELRTPLNSIIGFSRVILKGIDGPLTDLQRQDLEAIHTSGQHLLRLINDILDISKVQAGKMELSFEEVDLNEIIRAVMSTAIALVKDKEVELQQSIPDDLPEVIADGRRIQQVLLNLVSNAAKFTEEGFIRVSAEYDEEEVTLSVADSGIGIPDEKMGTIFEAFMQADASPSRRYGGTGLGLTISRQMVDLHGGEMWVESEVGVGSTFYFTLPISGPPFPELEEELEEEPLLEGYEEESKEGKLVLCVEDDEGVITLYRRYLRKRGYQVVGLTDPTNVVEEVKRLQPHAITLDVMMPDKDGWQVIQELKADPETRHIPIIMCTIVSEKDRGMSLGAADYLVKPILEQDLLEALDRLDREAGRHVVLVVDDQEEDRALLRRMIESQEGYEVIEASGGREAITMVKRDRPHMIILDLMMPEVDGFAVLEAVKSDETTRTIPIIIVTAKELTKEETELLNHRIEVLIQKGVLEREELLEDVANALRKLGRRQSGEG